MRELTGAEALSLLWEASDVVKEGSETEFREQLHALKRADVDLAFRAELVRCYQATVANIKI
jgi:hypothetical protein